MATLTIQSFGTKVTLASERLMVSTSVDGVEATSPVHLAEIDRVILGSRSHITGAALAELMRRRIPVAFVTDKGRFLGSFEPSGAPRGLLRYAQFDRHKDSSFALTIARKLIRAKICNQRRLIQRIDSNHNRLGDSTLSRLAYYVTQAERAGSLDTLRGCEGAAAAEFYTAWGIFLPLEFPFRKRTRRPPGNPVNACLSYISAMLYGEVLSACHKQGLDAAFGHLHPTTDDRWSLPLDLMEPFRPCVINALTLRLFSHRILNSQHFEEIKGGGTYLNAGGRRTLIQHYEKHLNREHYSEFAQCRTSLRRQVEQVALHYKTCLHDPGQFSPFRMN